MVDFNQGLSLGDALHRCHALDDQGLYWLEEPIAYNNLAGFAQLARELKTPIQLGENFYGPRALCQALAMGCGDYVMPDLMRIGGVTGWLRSAAIAGAAGHRDVDAPLSGIRRASHARHRNRALARMAGLGRSDCAEPFKLDDGMLVVPNRPGAGIEWNEDAVKRYRYDA